MPKRNKIALLVAGGQIGMGYSEKQEGHAPVSEGEFISHCLPDDLKNYVVVIHWSRQPSSHYSIRMTTDMIHILNKLVIDGVSGIVVVSGTDSIEEMAYLTDLLWAYPQPVIFTGSILPPDVSGSDAATNINQAINAVRSQSCWGLGVMVCIQDQLFSASEITQTANHRRAAFHAPDRGPVAEIIDDKLEILRMYKRPKVLEGSFSPAKDVELLWVCLGASSRIIKDLAEEEDKGLDGLVIAGFGNGNIPPSWTPHVKTILKREIPVLLTSRCLTGHVKKMFAYEGSVNRLLECGVLNGGNLSPVHGRLKLAVGIGAGLKGAALQEYLLS